MNSKLIMGNSGAVSYTNTVGNALTSDCIVINDSDSDCIIPRADCINMVTTGTNSTYTIDTTNLLLSGYPVLYADAAACWGNCISTDVIVKAHIGAGLVQNIGGTAEYNQVVVSPSRPKTTDPMTLSPNYIGELEEEFD